MPFTPIVSAFQEKLYSIKQYKSPIRLPIFYEDSSLLRFVSKTTPLSNIKYIPTDLVSISGSMINQAGRSSLLRLEARNALWNMGAAFEKKF